jgi:hypothetical protein
VRAGFVLLLGLWLQAAGAQTPTASPEYFQYHRSVTTAATSGEACAVIDPEIFPHAAPSLKDLRLYQGGQAIPYAITLSEPEQLDSEPAKVLNLGMKDGAVVFDLEMPGRAYTDVALDLGGKDFLATATVSGMNSLGDGGTRLGEFTLFDLSSQRLSRNTTLHLQESSFRYLHVSMTASAAPGAAGLTVGPQMVRGAMVPPSREAQTLFTTAITIKDIQQRGRETVGSVVAPARMPVERISFVLASSYKGNFSRGVRVTAQAEGEPAPETASGTILHVHLANRGREVQQEELSVPAVMGANLKDSAKVEVAVENGDDVPLPIAAILVEMRERKLCFDAKARSGSGLELYYGDSVLMAPQYDFARLFSPSGSVAQAQIGPEQRNAAYRERPDTRSFEERHPGLLWVVLLIVICVLAVVALRSSKALPR